MTLSDVIASYWAPALFVAVAMLTAIGYFVLLGAALGGFGFRDKGLQALDPGTIPYRGDVIPAPEQQSHAKARKPVALPYVLDPHVEGSLRHLEWIITNPFEGRKTFDPAPFLALIERIPLQHRGVLVLRDIYFFDDGCTLFTEADQYYAEIRVEAINNIFALYYAQVEQAYRLAGFRDEDYKDVVTRSRAHWAQNAYLDREGRPLTESALAGAHSAAAPAQ